MAAGCEPRKAVGEPRWPTDGPAISTDDDHGEAEDGFDHSLEHDRPGDRRDGRARHAPTHDAEAKGLSDPGRKDGVGADRAGERPVRGAEANARFRVRMADDPVPRAGLGRDLAEMEQNCERERAQRCTGEGVPCTRGESEDRIHALIVRSGT